MRDCSIQSSVTIRLDRFLFWKVDEKNKDEWTTFEFIRQFDKEHPNNPEANFKGDQLVIFISFLDGQQRITSLYHWPERFISASSTTGGRLRKIVFEPTRSGLSRMRMNPQELIYQFSFRESSETKERLLNSGMKLGKSLTSKKQRMRRRISKDSSHTCRSRTLTTPT